MQPACGRSVFRLQQGSLAGRNQQAVPAPPGARCSAEVQQREQQQQQPRRQRKASAVLPPALLRADETAARGGSSGAAASTPLPALGEGAGLGAPVAGLNRSPPQPGNPPLVHARDLSSLAVLRPLNGSSLAAGHVGNYGTSSSSRGDGSGDVGGGGDDEGGTPGRDRRGAEERDRRRGKFSDERRQAISQAMQKRGPHQEEHRRNIARGMRAAHAAKPTMRTAGRPKRCGHCGLEGHNQRRCPLLDPGHNKATPEGQDAYDRAAGSLARKQLEEQGKARAVAPRGGRAVVCGACGQPGHNRLTCAGLVAKPPAGAAGKVVYVEEVDAPLSLLRDGPPAAEDGAAAPPPGLPHAAARVSAAGAPLGLDAASAGGRASQGGGGGAAEGAGGDELRFEAAPPRPASASPPRPLGPGLALSDDGGIAFALPTRREQSVAQAAGAVLRAWEDGVRRQALELLLPQSDSSMVDGGWPGGIRQQFRAALPLVEDLLLRVKRAEGLEGRITAEWLDEGDCVAAWQSERLAAVLFASADALPAVQRIDDALSGRRLTLLVNPQWQPAGQVVSDFGFGRSRRAAERYIDSLEEVYCLRRVRVLGDELRVLRCYPGRWQVHFVRAAGLSTLVAVEDSKPTYQRLLELLKTVQGSRASKNWLDRALTPGSYDEVASYEEEESREEGRGEQKRPAAALAREAGGVELDIVTGEVVMARDYRMQPVREIARWLGADAGGSHRGSGGG